MGQLYQLITVTQRPKIGHFGPTGSAINGRLMGSSGRASALSAIELARGANDNGRAAPEKIDALTSAPCTFRSAAIDGGEVTLRVRSVILGAGSDFRFTPESDRIAALRQVTRRAKTDISSAACWAVKYVADPSSEACYRSE
jgi:hypothetical protein